MIISVTLNLKIHYGMGKGVVPEAAVVPLMLLHGFVRNYCGQQVANVIEIRNCGTDSNEDIIW